MKVLDAWLSIRSWTRYLPIHLLLLSLSSCNVYKHLEDDQKLLTRQSLEILDPEQLDDNVKRKGAIESLIRPEINKRFLWNHTGLWAYYRTENVEDPSGWERFLKNSIAEDPVLVDSTRHGRTAQKMVNYLNQVGYYRARVDYQLSLKEKKGAVKYLATVGPRRYIQTIRLYSRDPAIDSLLKAHAEDQILIPGAPISKEEYDAEVNRISNLLRNNGYASFYPNYIDRLRGDTLGNMQMEILLIDDSLRHETYNIGNVDVYIDDYLSKDNKFNLVDSADGVQYYSNSEAAFINPRTLARKLDFGPDRLYRKEDIDQTRVQLGNIPLLRRVAMTPTVRPGERIIDYSIRLQRQPRRAYNVDLQSGYAIVLGDRNRIGINAVGGILDRNLLGGGESFSSELQLGVEFGLFGETGGLINTSVGMNNRLSLPFFHDTYGMYKIFLSKPFNEFLDRKATTDIRANFQYVDFRNYYSYRSVELDLTHRFRYRGHDFNISPTGISLWLPRTSPEFDEDNRDNPNLLRSFEPRIITSVIFPDINWGYSTRTNARGGQWNFIGSLDLSGFEAAGINWIANRAGHEGPFRFSRIDGRQLQFAHYIKAEIEARWSRQLADRKSLHGRVAIGAVQPLFYSRVAPYAVQFGVGGPYSLRAWDTRQLGPGGVDPPSQNQQTFARKGDFKLEMNVEYRLPLFWYWNFGLFLDAGNVWLLNDLEGTDPRAILGTNFYEQIAIGGGMGLRLDFKYFVIRFDMGWRFREPYRDENGKQWVFDRLKLLQNNNFVLGIGYPF